MKNITSNKFFIPGFAIAVTLFVVIILVFVRGGVPGDAVAVVDGEKVATADFDKTMRIFAAQSQPNAKGKPIVADPPTFVKCIANKRKTAPKKTKDADLKKQCEQEYNTQRDQVMTGLIERIWYEKEAKDRGIEVSETDVKQQFTPLKQQTFPKEENYKKYLSTTGQTEADLLALVRNMIVKQKISEQTTKVKPVTAKEVEDQYNKNKDQYAQPETRDLLLVMNNKEDQAKAAYAALQNGDSFKAVAKKYSQDSASKEQGGKAAGVTKGQYAAELEKEIFKAKEGVLVGPIKTQFGYYVFKVEKINKAKQQALKEASAQIKQQLTAERQQKAYDDFQKEFTEKWKKKTNCREGYVVDQCKNAPKKKEGETGAAGAVPAG